MMTSVWIPIVISIGSSATIMTLLTYCIHCLKKIISAKFEAKEAQLNKLRFSDIDWE